MLRWIVASSLKYRYLVMAVAVALMVFGIDKLRDMPVDVFPEFAPPLVEVQTICLGLSPAETEELVTIPLEEAFNGLPNLEVMRSKSVPDLSQIQMIFERGTDLIAARQLVSERLAVSTNTIPRDVGPAIMLQPLSATSRCMKIGVSSKNLSVIDLSMIGYWTIRNRLLRVDGVANVAIWGERIQMLQVQVDPARLHANKVSLDQVMEGTSDALDAGLMQFSAGAHIGTGGFIDTPNQRLSVRHKLPIVTPEDLGKVTIGQRDGKALHLSDVATMVEDHQPLVGDAVINDGPGLLLIVEKFPWANTLQVTKGVEEAIDEMRPGLPGVDIDTTIFRPATFIATSIENLSWALFIGCVLLVLVLIAFLFEWRIAMISCIAIPLSLLSALLVLYLRGTTINTMILAGFVIALGDIVDDAIIDIENVVRRLRERKAAGLHTSIAGIILEASLEVRGAIVYATLIEVLAIMPVFFMVGLAGAFFKPLALSYALALLVSMVVALTVTPALSLIFLSKSPPADRESPIVTWLKRVYAQMLAPIVRSPRTAYVVVGITVLAGALVLPKLGQSLLPDFKERDFLMHWLTPPGTSHPEMIRITTASSKELRAVPGVRNFGAHIGQALIMDEVVGMYFGENWISVEPSVDYDKTLNSIQEVVDGYPGLYRDVQTYLKERIREVLTGAHEAITIRIFGRELDVLRTKADEVKNALDGIEGIVDLHVELQKEIPEIAVQVDLKRAKDHGLKPGDVRRAAATLVSGMEVGDIFRDGKAYDVNVWSTPETRHSVNAIRNLMLDTPAGEQVRLQDVASVDIKPSPNVIKREGMARRIDVGANVRGRDLGSVVADVKERLAQIEFPHEYHPELLGEFAERQAAQQTLTGYMVLAAIGIFLLLHASFRDWRLATLSFLTLPSALVGGVLAAYLGDGVISLGSLVGFLTVLGIAARNGIMLIDHFQHLEKHEGMAFGPELVLRGALERISPIMMTALTTALALAPLLVAGSIPGHEIEHPMAMVILGGLITSTLLNLFVVPSLYLQFAARREPITEPVAA